MVLEGFRRVWEGLGGFGKGGEGWGGVGRAVCDPTTPHATPSGAPCYWRDFFIYFFSRLSVLLKGSCFAAGGGRRRTAAALRVGSRRSAAAHCGPLLRNF